MMILMLTIGFGDWQDNPSNGLTPFVVAQQGECQYCLLVIIMVNIIIMIMITIMRWSWLFTQEIIILNILF